MLQDECCVILCSLCPSRGSVVLVVEVADLRLHSFPYLVPLPFLIILRVVRNLEMVRFYLMEVRCAGSTSYFSLTFGLPLRPLELLMFLLYRVQLVKLSGKAHRLRRVPLNQIRLLHFSQGCTLWVALVVSRCKALP